MSDLESSREAFERALEVIKQDYQPLQDGEELIQKITQKFTALYNDPHVSELKRVVGDVNIDDARSLLFDPSVVQRRMYPLLLQKDSLAPNLRMTILSLVYTLHRKSWTFLRDFLLADGLSVLVSMLLEPNLYARGQVCEIILTIIDSDEDRFDWFVPYNPETDHSTIRGHLYQKLAVVYKDSFLDNLIKNSCSYDKGENKTTENSFPGGSGRCLQILAFWLSWVRVQFTSEHKLQLSGDLLSHLKSWAVVATQLAKEAKENEPAYKKNDESIEDKSEEEEEDGETKLANTLVEDFGAAGEATVNDIEMNNGEFSDYYIGLAVFPESFHSMKGPLDEEEHLALIEKQDKLDSKASIKSESIPPTTTQQEAKSVKSSSATPVSSSAIASISPQQLKDMGNDKFFANKYWVALGFYSIGLKKLNDDQSSSSSGNKTQTNSLMASLYYNCASCYWKVAATDPNQYAKFQNQYTASEALKKYALSEHIISIYETIKKNSVNKDSLLEVCMENCSSCLTLVPTHRRALHRLASCFHAQEKYQEALTAIEKGLSKIPTSSVKESQSNSKSKQKIIEEENAIQETKSLHDLRRLCVANILLTEKEDGVEDTKNKSANEKASPSGLVDNKVNSILGKLKARHTREVNNIGHAWDGVDRSLDEDEEATTMMSATSNSGDVTSGVNITDLNFVKSNGDEVDVEKKSKAKRNKNLQKENEKKKAEEDLVSFQKKCLKHNKALRKLASDFMTPQRKKMDDINDGSPEYKAWIASFHKGLKSIWKGNYSLAQIFGVKNLDEDILFAFTCVLMDKTGEVSESNQSKILQQLKSCAGFPMVVNFLFSDDSMNLKDAEAWKNKFLQE